MTQFLGTHTQKLDKKGRVSVPADFRSALARIGADQLVLRPHHALPCIEVWPRPTFEAYANTVLAQAAESGEEYDAVAAVLYDDARYASHDSEGRLVLPAELVEHARLTDGVTFAGRGTSFQIWEPEAARQRRAETAKRVTERGMPSPAALHAPAVMPFSLTTNPRNVS